MKEKGIVFDVQRNALNDGPGIRTTIFLKGCPLRCVWCHNPEAQSFKPQLFYSDTRCQNCFTCLTVCKNEAHLVVDDQHCVDFEKCQADGHCVQNCPFDAVEIKGAYMTANEIIEITLKDKKYFDQSGGGITISGGEPMSQFEFTYSILKNAKEHGIHTCLDTSGYSRNEHFKQILPWVDLFLFDYKETNPERHHEFTGVNQQLIIKNLEYLVGQNQNIILRCPIIPGYNDNKVHFKGISALSKQHNISVEILPFHHMAKGKLANLGIESTFPELDNASESTVTQWIEELQSYGCLILR